MRSTLAIAAFLAAGLLATRASGQTASAPTGNLYGTVLDADANAVEGAAVTLRGPGATRIADTDRKGTFHFLNLAPGAYSLEVERVGFESARRDQTVWVGRSEVVTIRLAMPGVAESITVRGGGPTPDSRKVETGATFGSRELEEIPTTRDPWAVLRQVPGVLLDTVNVGGDAAAIQPAFVGKGSRSDQNSYSLDGVAISLGGVSPLFFDFDSFSNIEVTTGGSDPALATPGVTLNLVTKRGTNDLRGSGRGLYAGGSGWDYGIEAGGPLLKDRVWLWNAFARNDYLARTRFLRTEETLRSQETLTYWNAKGNVAVAPANDLVLSSTHLDRLRTGLARPDSSQEATVDNTRPGASYRIEDSQVFSASLFASGYLSYVSAISTNTPEGGVEEQADQDPDGIWRHSYQFRRVFDRQRQAGLNASAFFDTGPLRHELRFGFAYRNARFGSAIAWPGDELVGSLVRGLADVTRSQNPKSDVNIYGMFLGDTMTLGRLTANAGVRFDYQQAKNLPSAVSANPIFPELLPAVVYGGDAGYPITWREVQPRFGATYAVGAGRTLLRFSYSRFADPLDSATVFAANAFPEIATLSYVWSDANGNGRVEGNEIAFASGLQEWNGVDPSHPSSSVQVNRIASDFRPSTTDELLVGVERQIGAGVLGSVAFTYRRTHDLAFSPITGTTRESYQYFGSAAGTAVAADGFALPFLEPYYGLVQCPEPCVGKTLQNRPDAHETYAGVELQVAKPFSNGWMARASFAYNDWRQHIGPGAIVNPNNATPGVNASGPAVEGTSDGAINAVWQFNLSGMTELPFGISAGLNFFGRQGFPIPYFVTVFTGDATGNAYDLQIGPVARYRTPDVYQLDLQLSRPVRIGPRLMVIPQFTCLNLLDSHTVLQRDGFVGFYDVVDGVPTFDQNESFHGVFERLGARVFRGGVRITF